MAEPDIKLAVTADVSQAESAMHQLEETTQGIKPADGADALGAGIEKLGDACRKAAGSVAALDLDALKAQFSALRGIDNTVGGLSEQLASFETRLKQLEGALSEGVDGYGELSSAFYELLSVYKSGAASADEVKAAFNDLVQSARAQNDTVKEARREIAGLSGDQSALIEAKREEVEAYNKTQAAARAELDAFIKAQEEKAARRQLEMQSIEQLEQKLDELDRRADEARSKGDAAAELEAVKAQESAIAAIERKTAAQEKANERAQAAIEKIEAANRREAASIQELTEELEKLKDAQEAAAKAGDVQSEAQYAKAAQETADALERKQAEAEKVAAVIEKAAQAAEREALAAKKEAAALESTRRRMNLATKSAKELADEVARLTEAREKAAEAGDEDAYADLTEQLGEAKSALGELSKEANISKTALLGKAQAGAQAAQQLGSLAQQVRSGNIDLANMTNTIMSVGMAIKAGLGPIGWAMAAVQGLQMAWEYFSQKQEKAEKAAKAAKDAIAALNSELKKQADALREAATDEIEAGIQRELDTVKSRTDMLLDNFDREADAERARTKQAMTNASARAKARKQEMRDMVAAGKMSETAMLQEAAGIDRTLQEQASRAAERERELQENRLSIIQDGQKKEKAIYAQASERFRAEYSEEFFSNWSDKVNQDVHEYLREFQNVESSIAILEKEKDSINARMESAKAAGNKELVNILRFDREKTEESIQRLTRHQEHLTENARDALKPVLDGLQEDHIFFQMKGKELLETALEARKQGQQFAQSVQDTAQSLKETERQMADVAKSADLARDGEQIMEQANAARKRGAEAAKAAAYREERWCQIQQKGYAEQEAWLREQIEQMVQGTKLRKEYEQRLEEVQQKQIDAEWQRVEQSWTLENQAKWLKKQQEQAEYGSQLWWKYQNSLIKVNDKIENGILKEASKIEKECKLSRDYTKKGNKTQAQIFEADKRSLDIRRAKLTELLGRTNDAATRQAIEKKLQEIDAQLTGINASMAQAAREARRWVRALEPPKLDAARKGTQRQLNNLANAYRRMAQRAAKAADKGDIKGFDRAQRSMDAYARSMGRLAAKPGDVERYHEEVKRKIREAAGAADTGEKEEKRAAKASKQKADATEKAAKAASKAAASADTQTQSIVDLGARVVELQNVIKNITRAVETLNNSVTGTTQAAKAAYDCIISCASSTERAVKDLNSRCAKAESRIGRLEVRT